jgi:hypothetical protein
MKMLRFSKVQEYNYSAVLVNEIKAWNASTRLHYNCTPTGKIEKGKLAKIAVNNFVC